MEKHRKILRDNDIVEKCPRYGPYTPKPTVYNCIAQYIEAEANNENGLPGCKGCLVGQGTRKNFSMNLPPLKCKDKCEDTFSVLQTRRQSAGVKPITRVEKDKTKQTVAIAENKITTKEKVAVFLQIMAKAVADSPRRWIGLISILDEIKIYPWLEEKGTLLEFEKLGLLKVREDKESCVFPFNYWQNRETFEIPLPITFCLTTLGIKKAGLEDKALVAPLPPVVPPNFKMKRPPKPKLD